MINLDDEKQKEIVLFYRDLIEKRKLKEKDFRENIIPQNWQRYFGTYSSKLDKSFPWEGASDYHIPFSSFAITALESRFVNGIFSSRRFASISDLTGENKEVAPKVEDAINFYLVPKMKIYDKVCDMFQGLLVEGTRFLKIYPVTYTKKVYKYKLLRKIVQGVSKVLGYEVDMENKLLTTQIEKKVFVPKWEDISVVDMYWEEGATDIQSAFWVAQRLYKNKYEIMNNKEWINTEKYKEMEISKKKDGYKEEVKAEFTGINPVQITDYSNYEIYEIWGKYDLGDGEKDYQFVIDIKNQILLFADENKFFDKRKPYVAIPCYRIAGQISGQSLPQRIALLNDELDTIHNITIDNATLANAMTYMYIPRRGFDPSRVKIRPGAAIPVPSFDIIQQWKQQNVTVDLYKLESFILGLIEKMSMVTEQAFGREQVERPTARGTLALLQEFASNVNFLLKNIQAGLKEAIYQTLQTMYEFMPSEGISYFSDKGENKIERIDLEDIDDFEIEVLGDVVRAMKDVDKETALTLLNIFGKDQSGEVDVYTLKKNLVETIDPRIAKQVMRTPEEVRQLQEAKQQILTQLQLLKQKQDELMAQEGMLKEKELEQQMKEAGYDDKTIQKRLKDFRRTYIKNMVKGGQNENV